LDFKYSKKDEISIKIKVKDKIIGKAKIISISGNDVNWNLRIYKRDLEKITNSQKELNK